MPNGESVVQPSLVRFETIIAIYLYFSLVYDQIQPFLKKIKNLQLQQAKCELNDKLFQIVSLHYGLDGISPLSFEEMSLQIGLPTEILGDYEKKAIRHLRHPSTAKLIVRAIKEADQDIWCFLSNGENVVYKQALAQKLTTLPGEYFKIPAHSNGLRRLPQLCRSIQGAKDFYVHWILVNLCYLPSLSVFRTI